ncbi:C_GCAxxG_C_C family probable redox protein [Desulfotomaculum arcticum]|uniref:C_GCAxxG_C_C family probable redox protein n=1 Tax=Desulfotruncus arcticus DSM 17038 TaxID=1121424 RepID=A0A1I2QQ26_9FIRM|nr:DV_1555 family C-GCAxxG-C-C protein [Desulfotruncus arcticus]SFG30100.1 C_GCAxxG_C_C family probable redox protein [Desulfotomaculum arcticum] [Desulfotruncus arcticus DSM 17038]
MNDSVFRMFELAQQGFSCAQVLMLMGLEAQGQTNPELVRAMNGLAGGLGFSGKTCGALVGGVCLLGLYAGRGKPGEKEHDRFESMVNELVEWFGEHMQGNFECAQILGDDLEHKQVSVKCGNIVAATYDKIQEILEANGIDPAGGRE